MPSGNLLVDAISELNKKFDKFQETMDKIEANTKKKEAVQ